MIELGRREAIGVIGVGLAMGVATPAIAARPTAEKLDFAREQDRLKAYMLMHGALDDRLVIGCISGNYFGVINDEITPLWDVVSATFSRYRRRDDGGYDGFTGEVAYFIDPRTGRAPGRFHNPYTDEMVDEPQQGYPPSKVIIGPDLSFSLGQVVPGLTMNHRIQSPEVRGGDVWFSELSQTAMSLPGVARPMRYSESIFIHARRSDLETRGVKRVRTDVGFTNFVSWRPWMKMGDRPGHMTAVGSGSISDSMDILPAAWIAATRERRPELLDNPGILIDALWQAG